MQCQIFCELAAKKILIIDDGAMELTFPSIPVIIVPTYIKLILFCEGKHALDKNWKEWVAFLRSLIKNRFKMSLSKLEFRAR